MTRHWPVLDSGNPRPDKWSQFSTDQLEDLVCRHPGHERLTEYPSREELIAWLEEAEV